MALPYLGSMPFERPRRDAMPTTLPIRARKKIDLFMVFVIAVGAAFFVIEVADPAPMDVEAGFLASP
jgi:hypothetical protein